MDYCNGVVTAVRQCGGCVEVEVTGERPGVFLVDNSCFRMIRDCEGADWIGRPVEYQDAHMRFLDTAEALAEAEDLSFRDPQLTPARLPNPA